MPKSSQKVKTYHNYYFQCDCGMEKQFADNKSMMSGRNRHIKYCVFLKGKELYLSPEDERKFFNNNTGKVEDADTDKVRFYNEVRSKL